MNFELTKYGTATPTLFHLLGNNEVDVTAVLGYALAHAPGFAEKVLAAAGIEDTPTEVHLEQRSELLGRTDVEIQAGTSLLILEAKLGFAEPSEDQIERYARILMGLRAEGRALTTAIIATTGWPDELAERRLAPIVLGSPVRHVSWRSLAALSSVARASETREGKAVLDDFGIFLRSVIAMTNVDSNLVYVVSLGDGGPTTGGVTWRDVVADNRLYWHKVGGDRSGWPCRAAQLSRVPLARKVAIHPARRGSSTIQGSEGHSSGCGARGLGTAHLLPTRSAHPSSGRGESKVYGQADAVG